MEKLLLCVLSSFKIAEYKIHVLHTSMQGEMFLQFHGFLDEIYNFLGDQVDEIMEHLEMLGYDVPQSLEDIVKIQDEDKDYIVELAKNTPDITAQLKLVNNTLLTLTEELQEGIIDSAKKEDYVVQNDLINYQKAIRKFQWKIRRIMGNK